MPRKVDGDEQAKGELAFETLDEQILEVKSPVIEGARVVYLGNGRTHSVARPGRLLVDRIEEPGDAPGTKTVRILKAVSPEGNTNYDFSTHDVHGRLIEGVLCTDKDGRELVGRRWSAVEHPAHLHYFFRAKGPGGEPLYRVLVPRDLKGPLQEYISGVERRAQVQQRFEHELVTSGARA